MGYYYAHSVPTYKYSRRITICSVKRDNLVLVLIIVYYHILIISASTEDSTKYSDSCSRPGCHFKLLNNKNGIMDFKQDCPS